MNTKPLDISVIIPFKDKAKMTIDCVRSFQKFNSNVHEILLISNNSGEVELEKIQNAAENYNNVMVLEYNKPFNYQKLNNWAARQARGKFLFFLNNDTELVEQSRGLIERMYKKAADSSVGMVGCLLLYGDEKTIQHAGVYVRPGLLGEHLYVGRAYKRAVSKAGSRMFPYDVNKSRPLTAVTGAAQVIERSKFNAVQGFDERFIICGGDVDLCIRLNKKGYQSWYSGGGYIVHKESQSRSYKPVPYMDFYYSYQSYLTGYSLSDGDPYLPKVMELC